MLTTKLVLSAATLAANLSAATLPARAGDHGDAAVAGVAGFALGTLFGTAAARPRYIAPSPVYVAPPPVYAAPPVVYEQAPMPVFYAPTPWSAEWYEYCARNYGSFDARSGTFLGYDGYRHFCR